MTFIKIFVHGLLATAPFIDEEDVLAATNDRIAQFSVLHQTLVATLERFDVGVLASLATSVEGSLLMTNGDQLTSGLHGRERLVSEAANAVLWQMGEIIRQRQAVPA